MAARRKLLLVGWDSADWKIIHPLLDAGQLPGVQRLVERGTSGNLTTLEPQLSPMLWTSIATGKMAYHHGVPGFTEVDPVTKAVVPVSAATRQCRTVWEILAERGLRSHVVSWFATQGERDLPGKLVSNMFGHLTGVTAVQDPDTWPPPLPGTYWPPELAETMNSLRVSPHEIDPDQVIRLFVPDAPTVDQTKDRRLWTLAKYLAEAFSVHTAATHLMEIDPDWDFLAVYYRAVDELSHLFMPYHPPQMQGIPDADFALYKDVVNSTYRLHDMFLQRLMQLAGPDTAVMLISDHGFHSDHLRPKFTPRVPAGITVWHRPQGVFAAAGPGFQADELIYGARLLDVAPTVLHYFGLPMGEDMEGRVLQEAFVDPTPPATIPTWEPPGGVQHARTRLESGDSQALLDQFVALGYIDEVSSDTSQAAIETQRENDWNLARAFVHAGRHAQALPLLEGCCHLQPDRTDYAQALARCQLNLRLLPEAEATANRALETFGRTETARLLRASIAIQREQFAEALQELETVRQTHPEELQLQLMLAQTGMRLRKDELVEEALNRVLAADPHNPEAFLILARLRLHQQQNDAAVEAALEAIGLQYGNPQGHFLLGAALVQSQRWQEAIKPLQNALQLQPRFPLAHRLMSRVHRALGEPERAAVQENLARLRRAEMKAASVSETAVLRQAAAERAAVRQAEIDRKAAEEADIEPIDCVIVSGLPRSGTSLMMQMLRASGIEPLTDGQRAADDDNPEGYWEWEDIKKLPRNPRVIEQARGKAVKVISALLPSLPGRHHYKIIYMTRPVEQVVESQWKMLERSGQQPKSEKEHLIRVQRGHSQQILKTLKARPQVELLELSYLDLIADPTAGIAQLATFLGDQFTPSPAVTACVKPSLYRQRQAAPSVS